MGLPNQKVVEEDEQGLRVETPKGPVVRLLWKEKVVEAVLEFLRDTRVGYRSPG